MNWRVQERVTKMVTRLEHGEERARRSFSLEKRMLWGHVQQLDDAFEKGSGETEPGHSSAWWKHKRLDIN